MTWGKRGRQTDQETDIQEMDPETETETEKHRDPSAYTQPQGDRHIEKRVPLTHESTDKTYQSGKERRRWR